MNAFANQSSIYSSRRFSIAHWLQAHSSRVNVVTLLLLLALCFSYIVQVNHAVSKGYQIRDLESQIQQLTIVNQKLEVETQQAQALTNVARATKMLGLVRADRPDYVQNTGSSYALAE